jgi:hypothetical protein
MNKYRGGRETQKQRDTRQRGGEKERERERDL